jgi:plasmid replication initiation protein
MLRFSEAMTVELRKPLVVQANDLARSNQKTMTIHEKRLIWWGMCEIDTGDTTFRDIYIPVSEYLEESGANHKAGYKLLMKSAKTLPSRTIEVGDDENGWLTFQWVSEAEYIPAKKHPQKISVVRLRFHDRLKPYLLQLRKNYNKLDRRLCFTFSTNNHFHLYEILWHDSHGGTKEFLTYQVNDLRKRMGFEKQYQEYKDFRNLLVRAQKEFEDKGDLAFSFEGLYQGSFIQNVRFHIKPKRGLAAMPTSHVPTPSQSPSDLGKRLLMAGFAQDPELTIATYGEAHVEANLTFALQRIRVANQTNKPIHNPGGFIASCIQKNLATLDVEVKAEKTSKATVERLARSLNDAYDYDLERHFSEFWTTLGSEAQLEVHETMRDSMTTFERKVVEDANWEGTTFNLIRIKYLRLQYPDAEAPELNSLEAYVKGRNLLSDLTVKDKTAVVRRALKERE